MSFNDLNWLRLHPDIGKQMVGLDTGGFSKPWCVLVSYDEQHASDVAVVGHGLKSSSLFAPFAWQNSLLFLCLADLLSMFMMKKEKQILI